MKKGIVWVLVCQLVVVGLVACGDKSTDSSDASSASKAITAYAFSSPAATGVIDESAKTIAVAAPFGTNFPNLIATFSTTGARVQVGETVQVSGTTANDFTNPVVYTVTAADGSTTQYTVTVTVATNSSKALTSFTLMGISGSINESTKTVTVTVPLGTDPAGLIATFSTTGASVKIGGTVQVSGTTANDFTNPVVYTVTAADGSTTQYTVTAVGVWLANYIHLQSDAGDYIGGGKTYTYTQADALIAVNATGDLFSIMNIGDEWWSGDFQVPNTLSQLQPGTYGNLTRYPFNDPAVGGLDWFGDGRGCNTLTGSFVIDNAVYSNGSLTAIDLRFEQYCEGGTPALHGQIHWTSTDPTVPPGPVNPPPVLWQPASGVTPTIGNYVYLQSDSGDYIGAGQTYTYTAVTSTITATATGGHFSTNVAGDKDWSGDFQTMNTLSQLQPGYYGNLQRYPFNNPVRGGLDWFGDGRGCNKLTGWFVVDTVSYTGGNLTAIDLRFEQHCEGDTPALHGRIHWIQ